MPLLKLLPDRLKDTMHFLKILEETRTEMGRAPDDLRIVSLDIESLYPSIPQEEANTVANFYAENLNEIRSELKAVGIRTPPDKDLVRETLLHIMQDTILKFNNSLFTEDRNSNRCISECGSDKYLSIANWSRNTLNPAHRCSYTKGT